MPDPIDRFYGNYSQLIALAEWMADQPCTEPNTKDNLRCAASAKEDITWMCPACKFRQLRYGPYCLFCNINHKPGYCEQLVYTITSPKIT